MNTELSHFAQIAEAIADETRQLLKQERQRFLYRGREFISKEDLSPVTAIDQQVEQIIRQRLQQQLPQHGILGEEYGAHASSEEYVWVIDPIDGTKQFIAGIPVYGTLIALCHHGQPILGIIDIPAVDERWVGRRDHPTTLNGHPVTTRSCPDLSHALMSSSNTEPVLPEHRAGYEALIATTQWRVYGAACYSYGCLAAGRIDLSVDSGGMREVDYCALVPVIEGAGGVITDWQGKPLTLYSASTVVAAGDPLLHQHAIALLSRYTL